MQEAENKVSTLSSEKMSELLLASLKNGYVDNDLLKRTKFPFTPITLYSADLEAVFYHLSSEDQINFREGVVKIIKDWNPKEQKLKYPHEIFYLAGNTKALDAAPYIISIVENELAPMVKDSMEGNDTLRSAIGVLGHFIEEEDGDLIKERFKKWLYDPRLERYAGTIMNCLSDCFPENYPDYLRRFLEVAKEHPDLFFMDACINELIRVVTISGVEQHLDRLPADAKELVLVQLNSKKRNQPAY